MLIRIKKMLKTRFLRNVILLVTGTAAAQIITMGASPFITRIYGPEAFGILGAFNALIMIIGPISALSYPIAIVLPKKNDEAKSLVKLSLILTFFLAVVSLIVIVLFNNRIVDIFNLNEIKNFMYLLPIVILFSGLSQIFEQWLIRTEQFGINAKTTILQALITNLSKIFIGLYKPIGAILIIVQSLSIGLKAYLIHFFSKRDLFTKMKETNKNTEFDIKSTAKKYYDFPLYRSPQLLLNGVSMSLPILMLTSFFGPASAGYFTLSRTVLSAPTQLIGKSVGDVFYPRISKAANDGEDITHLLTKSSVALFIIGIIPFGTIIFFGPSIFSFVFGSDWVTAGEYARWVTLWVYFGFINRPSVMALPVLNAQMFHLVFTAIMLTSNAIALFMGYYFYSSDLVAVKFVGISGGIFSLILVIMTIYLSKIRTKKRV